MNWIEPSINVTEAAIDVVKNHENVRNYLLNIWSRLRDDHIRLPIFGAAGTGKSTFGKSLTSDNLYDVAKPYQESLGIELKRLKGPIPGDVIVAPGQKHAIAPNWSKLFELLHNNKAPGLCNIVSYGYHSFEYLDKKNFNLSDDNNLKKDLNIFLENRRSAEIYSLEELLNGLANIKNPIWMVTVINKQDIWWNSKDTVRQHYMNGEYNELILEFEKQIGKSNFNHTYVPCSLTIENFIIPPNLLMASTAKSYDIPLHFSYMRSCISKLHNLINPRLDI